MVAKTKVDWDAIEPHYRAGLRTLKDMSDEFGVSDAGIIKHAKKFKWTRNLKAKIKALAEQKVSELEVSEEVSKKKALTEAERVEIDSTKIADICFKERTDLAKVRNIYRGLFEEFKALCDDSEVLIQLKELVSDPETTPDSALFAFEKVVSFTGRVDSGKKLVETLKVLFELEAKIYKLHDSVTEDSFVGAVKNLLSNSDGSSWGLPSD